MSEKNTINRRQALKTLAAVTGAVSLASLPAWEKPVIEVGALPAHAQSSMATIRVINDSSSNDISVEIYQFNVDNSSVVEPNAVPPTLIAGPVTINPQGQHNFIVPPVAPTTTSDAGATEVTDCPNGYFYKATCAAGSVASQGLLGKCLAAGDVWEENVECK